VQVSERNGLAFPTILRSLLRQDPNVILIGEMRDRESMSIAIEAALTGHLVLSSLHTDRALESVVRLRQQGIESYLIGAALRGVISQRLVPKLCASCREPKQANSAMLERLHSLGLLEPEPLHRCGMHPDAPSAGIRAIKGRVGLYEVLLITPSLQAGIEDGLAEAELLELAPAGSYLPLHRYARHLLENGLASAESLSALFPSQATTFQSLI
jgi:type II secretory ATPase GspE/PulE/Tfp pilus assembly ATPase PilB-like protein